MNIQLITRHLNRSKKLVDFAHNRAAFACARFRSVIRDLDIRVSDINGPRGGTGFACLARVRLVSGGDVLVEGAAKSPEDGISITISRLANRLRRIASRRQDHH